MLKKSRIVKSNPHAARSVASYSVSGILICCNWNWRR